MPCNVLLRCKDCSYVQDKLCAHSTSTPRMSGERWQRFTTNDCGHPWHMANVATRIRVPGLAMTLSKCSCACAGRCCRVGDRPV